MICRSCSCAAVTWPSTLPPPASPLPLLMVDQYGLSLAGEPAAEEDAAAFGSVALTVVVAVVVESPAARRCDSMAALFAAARLCRRPSSRFATDDSSDAKAGKLPAVGATPAGGTETAGQSMTTVARATRTSSSA